MAFGNITLAARALEVCGGGGGRAYLCIELWIDGRRGERWARAQTVWDGEEFEAFTVRGLILRTNHPRPDGYLEGGEASQMLCGKHHTFSNARVCAKWCMIYNASIDRHGLPPPPQLWCVIYNASIDRQPPRPCSPAPNSFGVVMWLVISSHVNNISHVWSHLCSTYFFRSSGLVEGL